MFKDWTLLRKDGEDLPPPVAEVTVPAAKGGKKPEAGKKAPPPKKGAIEVITDNNPRLIST